MPSLVRCDSPVYDLMALVLLRQHFMTMHFLCSIMATSPTQSNDLLRELYASHLHNLDLTALVSYLLERGVITTGEARDLKMFEDREQQKEKICNILAAKGNSMLSTHRHLLRSFQTQQQRGQIGDDVPLHVERSQRSTDVEGISPAETHAGGREGGKETTALTAREARKEGSRARGCPAEVRGGKGGVIIHINIVRPHPVNEYALESPPPSINECGQLIDWVFCVINLPS